MRKVNWSVVNMNRLAEFVFYFVFILAILSTSEARKSCGQRMECVPHYLCSNNKVNTDGRGVINERSAIIDDCSWNEVCCSLDRKVSGLWNTDHKLRFYDFLLCRKRILSIATRIKISTTHFYWIYQRYMNKINTFCPFSIWQSLKDF